MSLRLALWSALLMPLWAIAQTIEVPAWFSESFLDIREDAREAAKEGKRLLLYFGQDGCPYCKALLQTNFSQPRIVEKTRRHFVALALNIWGDRAVTGFDGKVVPEKDFARAMRVQFTPTVLWCDLSPTEWLIRKMGQNLHMQTATWLVSRALTQAAGPWDTRLLADDDGEYFCRVLLASDGVRFVPEGRVFYRMSGSDRLSYIGRSSRKGLSSGDSAPVKVSTTRRLPPALAMMPCPL